MPLILPKVSFESEHEIETGKERIIQREFDKKNDHREKKEPQRNVVKSSNLHEKNMWCCVVVGAKEDRWHSMCLTKDVFFFKLRTVEINGQSPRCSGKSITNI